MNWIRIAVGIGRDPSMIGLARALGVSTPLTTGCCVLVLVELPTVSKAGDLSTVPDDALEAWAQWPGKRGKFATEFRRYLCTPEGVVRAWEKHNGAAMREADRRAQLMRDRRDAKRKGEPVTGNAPVTVTVTPALTRRDVTRRTTKQQLLTADASAPAGAGKFPQFPKLVCDAGYDVWLTEMGATNYGQFRNAFGPLFTKPEADRPTALPRDAELVPAIKLYVAAITGTPEARFASPKKCAESLTRVVEAMREGADADARLTLAQFALGTNQRTMFPTRTAA